MKVALAVAVTLTFLGWCVYLDADRVDREWEYGIATVLLGSGLSTAIMVGFIALWEWAV